MFPYRVTVFKFVEKLRVDEGNMMSFFAILATACLMTYYKHLLKIRKLSKAFLQIKNLQFFFNNFSEVYLSLK